MRIGIRDGVTWMGHPIAKRGVYFIATKRHKSIFRLNRFPSVIKGKYHTEAGVDGWVTKPVCEQTKVGQSRVRIVGVVGFDVAGTTDCIQHCLQL